jgi:hypothetical protein
MGRPAAITKVVKNMDLSTIKEVREVTDSADVNKLLSDGWKLYLIASTTKNGLTFILIRH